MSTARILGDADGASYYHVMSRTVSDWKQGMMFFRKQEKNVFAKQLRIQAEFSGIEVLTWCIMDNHFHLLIRVPARKAFFTKLMANGRKEFWRRLGALYSRNRVKMLQKAVAELEPRAAGAETGDEDPEADGRIGKILEPYTRRMADISEFMRGLKHGFSMWFNGKFGRQGTLWMDRFKSVLLEGDPEILNKVSAYIDLNPIRAGMVKDPADYRWSGYGQAAGGNVDARRGLSAVFGHERSAWKRVSRQYRSLLYAEGVEVRDAEGNLIRAGVDQEARTREIADPGRENVGKRLARRVRYFSEGAAVGGREFLEQVFQKNAKLFGRKRKSGARRFRGPGWKGAGFFALRDLGNR